MKVHAELISTAEQAKDLAERLRDQKIIAFDTEFIRESTFYPIVEIIQIATEQESWLVDAQAFKKGYPPGPKGLFNPGLRPLLEIFQDKKILKVVHAAQGDQECLYTSFGIVATPTLDTAVGASLCGYGDGIGLSKLLSIVLNVQIKKGHARTNWSVRPLPEQLIEYAHADVIYLIEAAKKLIQELDQLNRREWAMELSAKFEDTALYDPDIESVTLKLARSGKVDRKAFAALKELVKWREDRVRTLNLPRRWVADDTVLLDLAHVRPKDIEHLAAFRGLSKGELKVSGEAILAGLERASHDEQTAPPKTAKPEIPTPDEAQVLDLLRCYVGILADKHRISARHLLNTSVLLGLVRRPEQTHADLVASGLLSSEAAKLIGDELLEFVHGKKALSVKGNHIGIIEVKDV